MGKKKKKLLLVIIIIALSIIILLTCFLGSYLIYQVTKNDSDLSKNLDRNYVISKENNNDDIDSEKVHKETIENDLTKIKEDIIDDDSISDKNEQISPAGIKNINQLDLYNKDQVETFNAGVAKFIIYPLKNISAAEQEEGYFEAYQDINLIYTSEKLYNITNIFSFDYNTDTYIVVTAYSGGAHCCFTQYIFHKGSDNNVTLVKELVTSNSTIAQDNFFVEDGKLYFSVMDDRFAYFYTSYASSYSFVRFFQLDKNNLLDANENFQEEFLEEAGRCQSELEKINPNDIYSMEDWFPTLVCKTSNYWYGGDQNSAWSDFNDYFSKFGAAENPNDIKTEMEKVLNQSY